MADLTAWPDVIDVLHDLFTGLTVTVDGDDYTPETVGPRLPADLQDRLPLIRTRVIGGTDDRFTDRVRVDVEVYDTNDVVSNTIAEAARQRLLAFPHITTAGNIDWVQTESRPAEIPHDDPAVRLVAATYRISFRR